ncbi:MAG TPA: AraC family transcriptional regulator [Armatimonadota bacterium]|jgi:AraC-like DNA-binding protein
MMLSPQFPLVSTFRTALLNLLHEFECGHSRVCLPARVDRFPPQSRQMHYHTLPELVLQISGETLLECPCEDLHVRAGELCLTQSCLPHYERPQETASPFLNLVLLFTDQHIGVHAAGDSGGKICTLQRIDLYTRHIDGMLTYIAQMTQHWQMASPWHRQIICGLGMALVSELLEALDQSALSAPAVPHKVMLCTSLVMRQLSDPHLSVKTLADHLDWTPDYLSFAFHAATGTRLHTFIATQRHLLAKRLLTGSDLSIAEICRACGYEDPSYFTRIFKRFQDCTPGTYRRQHE